MAARKPGVESNDKSGVGSRESGTKKQQPVKEQKHVVTSGTPINKEAEKELQKQQRIFQQAEKLLSELNQKKTEIESKLSNPATYSNAEEFKKTEAAYQKVQSDIKAANATYEKAFELVMKLEEGLM
jgi:ATP-binding cassette subfamily F protein 3